MTKPDIIFFGNGPLADTALGILTQSCNVLFHARTKEDLETVKSIKKNHPATHGILASFGVIVKSDVLDLFEPEGILNIHPSLLPKYRGASPIESAILAGDTSFSVSIMKLVKKMDAGPIYYQTTITPDGPYRSDLKSYLYSTLAAAGATWICQHLDNLPAPTPQDDSLATFTTKFTTSASVLDPTTHTATELLHQILAFQGFPKSKFTLYGHECTILAAHISNQSHTQVPPQTTPTEPPRASRELKITCFDGSTLIIDSLQPAGRKPMDTKSFLNGYAK